MDWNSQSINNCVDFIIGKGKVLQTCNNFLHFFNIYLFNHLTITQPVESFQWFIGSKETFKKENNSYITSYSNIGWHYCNRCRILANYILFLLLCPFNPCRITCSSREMWLHWKYITWFLVWLSCSHEIHLPFCWSVTCPHCFCFSYVLLKCVR